MMKLAMDPRTRDLMEDPEFKGMLGAMNSNPGMMQMFMKDPRMMLVRGPRECFGWAGAGKHVYLRVDCVCLCGWRGEGGRW
jgi:hypothetical protein